MFRFSFMIVVIVGMIAIDLFPDDYNKSFDTYGFENKVFLFDCKIDNKLINVYSKELDYEYYYDMDNDREVEVTKFNSLTDVECKYTKD